MEKLKVVFVEKNGIESIDVIIGDNFSIFKRSRMENKKNMQIRRSGQSLWQKIVLIFISWL